LNLVRVPDQLAFFVRLKEALRRWARDGFPQAWPLLDFSDQPTRFVPVRLVEPAAESPGGELAILINGFPASASGARYFQLRATLSQIATDEAVSCWLAWEVVYDDDERTTRLVTSFIEGKPDAPVPGIAAWMREQLEGACDMTNRKVIPTRRTLRPA